MHAQSLSHVQLFCEPVDCSLPGSSVHGTLQARKLEWVAISFSGGSSRPRDQTRVSWTAANVGEDVEKKESIYIADGNVK